MNVFDRNFGILGGLGPLVVLVVLMGMAIGIYSFTHKTPSQLLASGNIEAFQKMIRRCPSAVTKKTKQGSLLLQAVRQNRMEAVPLLVRAGADVNEVNTAGYSLLSYALGNSDMVLLLIELGADVKHMHKDGSSLVHLAVEMGNPFSVYALSISGAPMNSRDFEGRAPIHLVNGASAGLMKCLLEQGANPNMRDKIGETALHNAAVHEDYDAALVLVNSGADLSAFSWQSWSALHLCAVYDSINVMCLLLESGVDVDLANVKGQTPMTCAVRRNNLNAVRALVGFGADLQFQDDFGNTPLHDAIRQEKIEVAKLLIDFGAPLDIKNVSGITPQHMIMESGQLDLIQALADVSPPKAESLSAK